MSREPATHALGPQNASLLIRTGREGVAARVGHDLTITFSSWSAQVVVSDDEVRVEATVQMSSFEVLEGTGGALPLTGRDRREITRTALRLLDVERYPEAHFVSTAATASGDGGSIEGELTIRGVATPVTIDVASAGDDTWRGSTSVLQTDFGITPHRALLGALKVADEVRIDIDATL